MKKMVFAIAAFTISTVAFGQKVSPSLKLSKGQTIKVKTTSKSIVSQDLMGQSIEFNIDGNIDNTFEVLDASGENAVVSHKPNRIAMSMEGMGQVNTFDSDNPSDLEGPMGAPAKEALSRSYEMTIDKKGKVVSAKETGAAPSENSQGEAAMLEGMLKGIGTSLAAPKPGEKSFFHTLPAGGVSVGASWTDTADVEGGKEITTYTLTEVTDTALVVDFTSVSKTEVKSDMMGMEATTTLDNKSKGRILLDPATGIMKQKTTEILSEGTVDIMGQLIPMTTKANVVTKVEL